MRRERDEVIEFRNGNALWYYTAGFLKAYTEDYDAKSQLEKVGGAEQACTYRFPIGSVQYSGNGRPKRTAWDFIIPSERRKTVEKILRNAKNEKGENQDDGQK